MAEYIEREAFRLWVSENNCADCGKYDGWKCRSCWIDDAMDLVDEAPTADVVPKSEVEKIFDEIEKIRLKEITRCEVMREKEYTHAQRNYWEGGEHSLRQLSYWIADFKKKYTEGNNEES